MYKVHRVVIGADDAPGAPIRCDFPVDCVGNLLEGHAGGRSGVRIECTDPIRGLNRHSLTAVYQSRPLN